MENSLSLLNNVRCVWCRWHINAVTSGGSRSWATGGGRGGFVLLALSAFLPSVVSSLFLPRKTGKLGSRVPPLDLPLVTHPWSTKRTWSAREQTFHCELQSLLLKLTQIEIKIVLLFKVVMDGVQQVDLYRNNSTNRLCLRIRGTCREYSPAVCVLYISRVLSNVRSVLSQPLTHLFGFFICFMI